MNVYKEDIDLDSRYGIQDIYDYFYIEMDPFETIEDLDDLNSADKSQLARVLAEIENEGDANQREGLEDKLSEYKKFIKIDSFSNAEISTYLESAGITPDEDSDDADEDQDEIDNEIDDLINGDDSDDSDDDGDNDSESDEEGDEDESNSDNAQM